MRSKKTKTLKSKEKECLQQLENYFLLTSYRYDPETILLEFMSLKKKFMNKPSFEEVIHQVNQYRNIVFYVPKHKKGIHQKLLQIGFQAGGPLHSLMAPCQDKTFQENLLSYFSIEKSLDLLGQYLFFQGSALDHKGIHTLLEHYLSEHEGTFLDHFGDRQAIFSDVADYHYFSDPTGRPLAFNKVIHTVQGREAEITYGEGTSRQNIAMMVYSFFEEIKMGTSEIEVNIPYETLSKMFQRMGFQLIQELQVFTLKKKTAALP